jgi:hypothetical protein
MTREAGILPASVLGKLEACRPGQAWKPIFQFHPAAPKRSDGRLAESVSNS